MFEKPFYNILLYQLKELELLNDNPSGKISPDYTFREPVSFYWF